MSFHAKWIVWTALFGSATAAAWAQEPPQQWSEAQLIERFQAQSLQARELQARVALAEAEAKTRVVYQNPSAAYSREGAGYNEFFEASQTLPVSGRIRYLRDAGAAAVAVVDANREATMWSLRSDLRVAFYRMVAAQERLKAMAASIGGVEQLIIILRKREEEGEGSRYDRLRAEREAFELRTDTTTVRSLLVAAAGHLAAYLPDGTDIREVSGALTVEAQIPEFAELVQRAMNSRADFRAEHRALARYKIEEQAARRLRIPEPVVTAGIKRGDVTSGIGPQPFSNTTRSGLAFSISVPIPVFNDGRYEVARQLAEQEQSVARAARLARQIRAEIQGARDVLAVRREALATYQREMESAGPELSEITRVAYQEGEIGILELLDSLRVSRASRLRVIDLQAAVREAWIELERSAGEMLSGEVRP